jgi:tetratricopeptide (TPR) repeat protein
MRPATAIAALLFSSVAAFAAPPLGESPDARILQGLRERRQFEAAEKYCADRLADSQLPDERRVELTIEWSRSLADHALESPPAEQSPLWQRARQVVDDFAKSYPRHPKLVLVRSQAVLAALAQGQRTREEAELDGGPQAAEAARGVLRAAIGQVRRLDEEVAAELKQRARVARPGDKADLSVGQLMSLETNLRHQLARGYVNQALCYPSASADRINSLTQASDLLAELAQQELESPLIWSVRLDEIECRRLLGNHATAQQKLSQLETMQPPGHVLARVAAERIHLALARGQIDEALAETDPRGAARQARSAEADYARLEAYLAGRDRALKRHDSPGAAEWEKAAIDQVRAIERTHPAFWTRQAESLVARSLADSTGSDSVESLVRGAQGLYRAGKIDEALVLYDRASRQARETHDTRQLFEICFTAATIEKEREHYRSAIDRYRKLAMFNSAEPRAGEAHLLAVHCAAQLAQQQQPPKLDEYERLLREHVVRWPKTPTASQAWWWLGRLEEHEHIYPEAIKALRNVEAGTPQYPEAVEALGQCYAALLAQLRGQGRPTTQVAHDAIEYFEQAIAPRANSGGQTAAAQRAATLAAARLWLLEMPNGEAKAEELLTAALANAADAPVEWKITARGLLVAAVGAQGRISTAEQLLAQIPITVSAQAISTVDTLAELTSHAGGDRRQNLAQLQLRAVDDLLARRDELDTPTRARLSRLRAFALGDAGRRKQAIGELESMAAENPRDGQTQEDLASLLMSGGGQNDLQRALAQWREIATKSRPGSGRWFRAHYGVARSHLDLGHPTQARAAIRLVKSSHPDLGGAEMQLKFQHLLAECERQPTSAKPSSPPTRNETPRKGAQ